MSERKTPPFSRSEADEQFADPAAAENRHGQQAAPERSAYAEDPLVELARIVSESAHFPQGGSGSEPDQAASRGMPQPQAPHSQASQPQASQQPAAPQPVGGVAPVHTPADPQHYELPDTFSSDLEAELIAELAPVYSPTPAMQQAPSMQQAPEVAPEPTAQRTQPVARHAEAPHVEKPMPRATPYVPGFQPPAREERAVRPQEPVAPAPAPTAGQASSPAPVMPSAPVAPSVSPQPVQAQVQAPVARAPSVETPAAAPQVEAPRVNAPSVRPVRDDDFYFGDPLAYDPSAELPDDTAANYADAAAQALEAAVQEELRLATLGVQDVGADTTGTEPDFGDFSDFREPGFDDVTPELEQSAPNYASSLEAGLGSSRLSLSDSDLRGSYDTGYAAPYAQQSYRVEPEPVAAAPMQPEPVRPEPIRHEAEPVSSGQGGVEQRFDAGQMQWSETEDFYADEPAYAQETSSQAYGQPQAQTGLEDDFDLDDIFEAERDAAPARVEHGALPEHSRAEKRAAPHVEPRRKGMIAAAAIAGLVVVGGGVFAISGLFGDSGTSGPPTRIMAEPGPMKVFPEAREASSEPSPSKAIYDRVAGVQPRDEQLVSREEQPIANVPTTDGGDARTVGGTDTASPATPKRVRTVVVRPDGTIIAAPDLPDSTAGSTATLDTNVSANAGANIRTVATTPAEGAPSVGVTTGTNAGELRVATTPDASSAGETAQPTLSIADAGRLGTTLTPRSKPEDAAALAAAAAPAVSAPIQRSGPLDLTGGQNTAAPVRTAAAPAQPTTTAASVPSGTYVVQVSSQRTREQAEAAYTSMQRRFPAILGSINAIYPSVDLGDRGTFYRVRIPAGSQAAAIDLCTQLKDAGGDCFVRRTE
ncbi:SPOR domain-containing protein [Breoghania sp.]|uniref:SPOR domain-containing protein n=1 Tax=Breoghania sp. TaxID=2065378 RepID=UPI002AAAE6FE|nr:SPOR domain-containing protein [Breoghania sp.]